MNLHKNAKTCPKSRSLMVHRVLEEERPVAQVAREFGVSPRTVYKWVQRFARVERRRWKTGQAGLAFCTIGSAKSGWI